MLDIYKTHYLLMAVRELVPAARFLRDRYFPTNDVTDIFATTDVIVEYKDGDKKLAPFVVPRKGGVAVTRRGYSAKRYEPAFIAPKRELTIDDLMRKGFGESMFSSLTPEARQTALLMSDFDELDAMISRREEAMAAETLLTNACVMNHIADKDDLPVEMQIQFYEDTNEAQYTPATEWNATGAKIIDDIAAAARMLKSRGLPATDLIVSADVGSAILADETILKLLDIRRADLGTIAPNSLPNGASYIGRINTVAGPIDIFQYDETYEADDGTDTPYIAEGKAILTAPACGRTVYGAVTQLEESDHVMHTYAGRRVPKYVGDAKADIRELFLRSRPLMIPNHKNAWITINAITAD